MICHGLLYSLRLSAWPRLAPNSLPQHTVYYLANDARCRSVGMKSVAWIGDALAIRAWLGDLF